MSINALDKQKEDKQELQKPRVSDGQQCRNTTCGWRRISTSSPAETQQDQPVLQNRDPCRCLCFRRGMRGIVLDSSSRELSSLLKNNTFPSLCDADNREPARVSERPRIPDLGHNKSPTGSLFLIAATRSSSRPSYKHPLPVLPVLLSLYPELITWRLMTSRLQNKPVLLRRDGSCWHVVPLLCSRINATNGRIYFLYVSKLGLQHNEVQGYRVSYVSWISEIFICGSWRTQMTQQTCVYKINVSTAIVCLLLGETVLGKT